MKKELRSGYTTGACATAAAKGAAQMLITRKLASEITITLPGGENATFSLHGQNLTRDSASCHVVKDAGDDPDVTNGAEVHARITLIPTTTDTGTGQTILITGGTGIGTVTKPGLAIPPGEWAINPVPRAMIDQAIRPLFPQLGTPHPAIRLEVTLSIPDGAERALKTLNARLGIIGGLSILGTTGIVRPISAKAWTDTIDAALDVAKACGCDNVVLSTGRSSELAVQKHLRHLSEEACIMMGDHVAYALKACAKRGFMEPIIACQFAKLFKMACGYENTHAATSELDRAILVNWAVSAQIHADHIEIISRANTAREIVLATGFDGSLVELVAARARQAAAVHAPGIRIHPLLCGYDGSVVAEG